MIATRALIYPILSGLSFCARPLAPALLAAPSASGSPAASSADGELHASSAAAPRPPLAIFSRTSTPPPLASAARPASTSQDGERPTEHNERGRPRAAVSRAVWGETFGEIFLVPSKSCFPLEEVLLSGPRLARKGPSGPRGPDKKTFRGKQGLPGMRRFLRNIMGSGALSLSLSLSLSLGFLLRAPSHLAACSCFCAEELRQAKRWQIHKFLSSSGSSKLLPVQSLPRSSTRNSFGSRGGCRSEAAAEACHKRNAEASKSYKQARGAFSSGEGGGIVGSTSTEPSLPTICRQSRRRCSKQQRYLPMFVFQAACSWTHADRLRQLLCSTARPRGRSELPAKAQTRNFQDKDEVQMPVESAGGAKLAQVTSPRAQQMTPHPGPTIHPGWGWGDGWVGLVSGSRLRCRGWALWGPPAEQLAAARPMENYPNCARGGAETARRKACARGAFFRPRCTNHGPPTSPVASSAAIVGTAPGVTLKA